MTAPWLALAFRPFFLAGPVYVVLVLGYWIAYHAGLVLTPGYWEATAWHAHEMLFGFVTAIVAGFLLTASRNWAGTRGVHGGTLLSLVLLWVSGRLGIHFSDVLPRFFPAALDLAFLPYLALLVCLTLAKGAKRMNYVFVFWLLVLSAANGLMHVDALGLGQDTARKGYLLAVNTMTVIMTLLGGRVIPMFTQNAVPGVQMRKYRSLEVLAMGSVIFYLISDLFFTESALPMVAALVAGVVGLVRLWGWRPLSTRGRPILWVLHVGYALLAVGLVVRGLSYSIFPLRSSVSLHLLTSGAMGTLILGMISRVALGHTGRPIIASSTTVAAYYLVIVGAVLRAAAPIWLATFYVPAFSLAGVIWAAGFALYALDYWKILIGPRVDGLVG